MMESLIIPFEIIQGDKRHGYGKCKILDESKFGKEETP